MFILVIIAAIFAIVLYLIKQEGAKHQASKLNIGNRKQSDFVDAINDVATEITRKEYYATGRSVHRDGGIKTRANMFYTSDFIASTKKKFNELMNKTSWTDGGFHPEFVTYVEHFYADATMDNFKEIFEEYITKPKPLPKEQKIKIQQLIEDDTQKEELEVNAAMPEDVIDEIEDFDNNRINDANVSQLDGLQKSAIKEKTAVVGGKILGNGSANSANMNQKVLSNEPNRIVPIAQNVKTTETSENKVKINVANTISLHTKSSTLKAPHVDRCMLHPKFVRLGDLNKFEKSFVEFFGFNELSGIFVCYNASKRKWYVGQGQRALQKLLQIFRSPNSSVPDLKKDWDTGDTVFVNFVRLKDTDYNTLDELECKYIEKYDCLIPKGYNRSQGQQGHCSY